ncbi:hypothetical protein N0V95_005980 [Ascochyta clinopodiicola]|nr:hypothetical protein N0V95_005980 [Ascochyta clinopodiicola]
MGRFVLFYFRVYLPQAEDFDSLGCEPDVVDDDNSNSPLECIWAYSTAVGAVHAIWDEIIFRYPDEFQPALGAKIRVLSAVENLLDDGYLTKQAKIDREQPLGVYHILRMVQALFQKAISIATTSWDATLQFSLTLVLQAAFGCPIGDILAPMQPEGVDKPGLYYSDVMLALPEGCHNVEDIQGLWKIRNAENSDGNPCNAYTVLRNALPASTHTIVCPVRLLLVNAIRRGNLRGSMNDVLEEAAQNNGFIQWIDPELPVLCHTTTTGIVDGSIAMKVSAARMILDTVAELVRPNVFMRTHDIQCGAAHEMTALPPDGKMTDYDIAVALNPSEAVPSAGSMREFEGLCRRDFWTGRVLSFADQKPVFAQVIFGCLDPVLRKVLITNDEVRNEMARRFPSLMGLPNPEEDRRYQKAFAQAYATLATRESNPRQQKRKLLDEFSQYVPLQMLNVTDDIGFVDHFASISQSQAYTRKKQKGAQSEIRVQSNNVD